MVEIQLFFFFFFGEARSLLLPIHLAGRYYSVGQVSSHCVQGYLELKCREFPNGVSSVYWLGHTSPRFPPSDISSNPFHDSSRAVSTEVGILICCLHHMYEMCDFDDRRRFPCLLSGFCFGDLRLLCIKSSK